MPTDELYAKDTGGTWRRAKPAYVKTSGVWQPVVSAWVKVSGTWHQVYGDSLRLTASGTVNGPNAWTFTCAVWCDPGKTIPGGGHGSTVVLFDTNTLLEVATFTDVRTLNTPITTDETASYTAEVYTKAGTVADSVIFTPT
jgi:hypothetical protein